MGAATLISHGFGSCWLFLAFVDDMCIELISLNEYKKIKNKQIILYEHLCAIIRFQNKIKKLSSLCFGCICFYICYFIIFYFSILVKWSECYRLIVVLNLLWTMASMAVTMVSFQMELVE